MDTIYTISDKLIVRPITHADTSDVVRWRANPRVINNFLYRGPFTADIHEKWMKEKVETGKVIQFIIEEKNETTNINKPIGSVYLRDVDLDEASAEYGIFIGEDDAIGCGYGNQVVCWAVYYAKEILKLKSLKLRALADNISAVKSYENAGFKLTETLDNYIDGRDLVFMRIDF